MKPGIFERVSPISFKTQHFSVFHMLLSLIVTAWISLHPTAQSKDDKLMDTYWAECKLKFSEVFVSCFYDLLQLFYNSFYFLYLSIHLSFLQIVHCLGTILLLLSSVIFPSLWNTKLSNIFFFDKPRNIIESKGFPQVIIFPCMNQMYGLIQQIFICSKPTLETKENCVKYVEYWGIPEAILVYLFITLSIFYTFN